MIARGMHIAPINEMYAIRKSDGGIIFDPQDVPYGAASGKDESEAITKAMGSMTWKASIEDEMEARQKHTD